MTSANLYGPPLLKLRRGRFGLLQRVEAGDAALYDLASDSGERSDASPRFPEARARLARQLEEFASRPPAPEPAPTDAEPGDADWEQQLQALGYLH